MAVPFATGNNFMLTKEGYRLPDTRKDTSIFLISDSFEYDVETIKKLPPPKIDYSNIIIPFKIDSKIGTNVFNFNKPDNVYAKQEEMIKNSKLVPPLNVISYPYPNILNMNLYISYSEVISRFNAFYRQMPLAYIKENICTIFEQLFRPFNFSKTKVILVDTKRYQIYNNPSEGLMKNDIINAILSAYYLLPLNRLRRLNMILWFKSDNGDFKVDLNNIDRRDNDRFLKMLETIGIPFEGEENPVDTPKELEDDGEIDEKIEKEIEDRLDNVNVDVDEEEIDNPETVSSDISNIISSINSIKSRFDITLTPKEDQTEKLRHAKELEIQAELLKRVSTPMGVQGNYKNIASDMTSPSDNSVEDKMITNASKKISNVVVAANTADANNNVSTDRERKMRDRIGRLKLGNITFDTLTSVTDVPKPPVIKPIRLSTTNPGALKGTSFTNISKAYEENLMDRDIVQTFMNLSKLPEGYEITNIEVTDISSVVSLKNDWKVSLRSKLTGRQNLIHIHVPKVINGKFYDNGVWYNIGKQDFPVPVLKLKPTRVMLTSNYQKITVERYDTKSLVDVGILIKVLTKVMQDNGSNKYIKPGSSVVANSKFMSTIEYDEYAKRWYSFINKEAQLEIYFNRIQCAKLYDFVVVKDDEFCCGMIDKVPIVINVETGLARNGKSLTEIMVETLPPNLKLQYQKTKPGTRSMYSEMNATIKTPVGVTCCAWEGLSNVLKKANAEYQFVNSNQTADMSGFFFIQFKDKTLAIRNTIQNQLLFNGFYRINTKAYNASEFEVPIMNNSSVYIDIYNQYFFKQYSQLTTFIAYYNFFVDAITSDVCAHFNVPNDIVGLLIYASNMLADNNYANELTSSLYRIRSTEVIPAIIHSQLAFAISRHKNRSGSKTRDNSLDFNPNCVIMDLEKLGTTETANALNPMVELHQKETITQKGFHGVNSDRAFNKEKRTYDSSMIGKIAMSSANNKNVGVNRQLVADPKILSVRGYTSTDGVDADYNDLQLASFTELLTPGGVSRDDAIRTTIGTAQTGHIVSTAEAQPCLISNGVDEIVPSAVSEEFSVIADADGKVLEINEGYMIIQYKNGRKKAIPIKDRYSANPGGGFYVNNKLTPNVEPNQSFKQGTILAYHEKFFNKGVDGVVRMNLGPLAKVAFTGLYSTYEDAGLMTESFSKKLATFVTMKQHKTIDATDNIEFIVKVGDEVEIGDPLIIFGLGDTGDKSVDNFLKAFGNDTTNLLDSAKRVVKAKHAGRIADVKMYTVKSMDKLSPSLHKLFDQYFKENIRKRKILDKYDKSDSVYKLDTLYDLPTGPMKGSVIKGFVCDVLVEIYIEHEDFQSVGDKAVAYGPAKQVISEMIPIGMEPYSESHPDEEVSMFVTDLTTRVRRTVMCVPIYSLNCWNSLMLNKLQHNDEICVSVNATKVEKIIEMAHG